MTNLYECYKILGVSAGASIADVSNSYRRLCRIYHPDISDDPESEEFMKTINMAYSVLREKLKREAALRERIQYVRQTRRHSAYEQRAQTAASRKENKEAEALSSAVLNSYFKAIKDFDYTAAYEYLCSFDKRKATPEVFIEWRNSVSRLFPIQKFSVMSGSIEAAIPQHDGTFMRARKFRVMVTEEDTENNKTRSGEVEKYVVFEDGKWKIFLGYRNIGELTRSFDKQFREAKQRDMSKRWDEYYSGLYPEYNMLSLAGLRNAVSREIYRQSRYGGNLTLAVMSIKTSELQSQGQEHLQRIAAKTICAVLRETDTPAYVGNGVFALLLVELRKKNAELILMRLKEKIRKNLGAQLGKNAIIEVAFESWSKEKQANQDAMNSLLMKFGKKL